MYIIPFSIDYVCGVPNKVNSSKGI